MKKYLLKLFLVIIVILLALFFFAKSVKSFLNTHSAFKIKKIEISCKPQTAGCRLKEKNIRKILDIKEQTGIFFLDLKKAAQTLEEKPEIKKAIIFRCLPDKLIIRLENRKPFVQIDAGKYFLIDEEGIILPEPKNFPFSDFPLIEGINFQVSDIKIGKRYISQNLDNALSFIEFLLTLPEFTSLEARTKGAVSTKNRLLLTEFRIKKVNIRNIQNVFFYLQINASNLNAWQDKIIELKIRNVPHNANEKECLAKKIKLLPEILSFHSSQDVRYIDLRFKDMIVERK